MGKFTLIFPFNKVTEQLSIQLNRQTGIGNQVTLTGPSHASQTKQLIQEIKSYYENKSEFLKGNTRY